MDAILKFLEKKYQTIKKSEINQFFFCFARLSLLSVPISLIQ
jgi:hypothetical protein